ncbi:hypothetical protein X732_30765 [Mesorhizobium sp. L2C066B000]|nr:hypothetical protein X732_30765 [Mesorhizobium sp. L2C066B000]
MRCARCKAALPAEASAGHTWRHYMGHVNIYATYWYLEATPDLLHNVATAGEAFMSEGRSPGPLYARRYALNAATC